MDQDFYIEENSPVKIILILLLFIGVIVGGIYYYFDYRKENIVKLKNVTVELGTKLSQDKSTYIDCADPSKYTLDLSSVVLDSDGNVASTGEYSYKISKNGDVKKGKIFVKDTVKPEIITQDLTVGVNEKFDPSDFVTSCNDLSLPCLYKYKNISDEELNVKEGNYTLDIIVSDSEGNEVTKKVNLIVSGTDTLANKKASDLTFNHLSEEDSSWNNNYTIKLDKALNEESLEFNKILEDYSTKELNLEKEVSEKKIILAYNKYNFVIGLSIKISFTDGTVKYIASNDLTVNLEENTEN